MSTDIDSLRTRRWSAQLEIMLGTAALQLQLPTV